MRGADTDALAAALKRLLDGDPCEELSKEDLVQILAFVVGGTKSLQTQIDELKAKVDGTMGIQWS